MRQRISNVSCTGPAESGRALQVAFPTHDLYLLFVVASDLVYYYTYSWIQLIRSIWAKVSNVIASCLDFVTYPMKAITWTLPVVAYLHTANPTKHSPFYWAGSIPTVWYTCWKLVEEHSRKLLAYTPIWAALQRYTAPGWTIHTAPGWTINRSISHGRLGPSTWTFITRFSTPFEELSSIVQDSIRAFIKAFKLALMCKLRFSRSLQCRTLDTFDAQYNLWCVSV